jgi:hypothetical protein
MATQQITGVDADGNQVTFTVTDDPAEDASLNSILTQLQSALDVSGATVTITDDGQLDINSLPNVTVGSISDAVGVSSLPSLPAGANAIGSVDVDNLPSLPAGGNKIGTVDVDSISSPSAPTSGKKTVSTAGTAEALVGSSTTVQEGVTVKALSGNGGTVYVGDSSVSASSGFELAAGEQVFLVVSDLANVYVDVDTGGEGVSFIGS